MSSMTTCYLCPGGASPINPYSMVTIPDGVGTYSCSDIADAVSSLTGANDDDELACLAFQSVASSTCCEQSWTSVCDAFNDPCPLAGDGLCMNMNSPLDPNGLCLSSMADCIDCDPCIDYHFTSCNYCTSAGNTFAQTCYWCPADSRCFSKPYLTYPSVLGVESGCSASESDWLTTCGSDDSASNFFNDPQYEGDLWAYRLINVEPVWLQGITGKGVRIRINDEGVDTTHPEFYGKFDIDASCELYSNGDDTEAHGTYCASIAAALGNNDVCAVGIAPDATLSSCKIIGIGIESQDPTVLIQKLQYQDVSSNSYGVEGCSPLNSTSTSRFLQSDSCPFIAGSGSPPCSSCDFSVQPLDSTCTSAIADYCSDPVVYEADTACLMYLEYFTTCRFNSLTPDYLYSFTKGVTEGRNGKGLIFVFASGNENSEGSDTNFEGLGTTRFTISVGAVGKDGLHSTYSTPGACLFISAPGGDMESSANWITAAPGGACYDATVGTSFATPVVSGVVALMLEVNPSLTWRDVQGILAKTARVADSSDESWVTNAAGFSHSNLYGFGIVDAAAAVNASRTWVNFGPERMLSASSGTVNIPIDDYGNAITSTVTVNGIMTVESVNVYLDVQSSSRGNLEITLVSPSGTESKLTPGMRPENSQLSEKNRWKLMTVCAWGESSGGQWTLSIKDTEPGDVSSCVDLPFNDDYYSDVDCQLVAQNLEQAGITQSQLCAEAPFSSACCFCGGGQAASNIQDQLTSWTLVIYGRDPTGNLEPTVSPAPTAAEIPPCTEEDVRLSLCLNNIDGGSSCKDCVSGSYASDLQSCSDVDDETCTGLESCSTYCGDCGYFYLAWLNCQVDCSVTCDSVSSPAPTSALSPASSPFAPAPSPSASSPVAPAPSPSAASPVAPAPSPSAASPFTLSPLASSPSASSPSQSCSVEEQTLTSCLNLVSQGSTCPDCVSTYYKTVDVCTDIDDETCTGLSSCPCGSCGESLLAWMNCLTGCTVTCNGPDTGNVPTASSNTTETPFSAGAAAPGFHYTTYLLVFFVGLFVFLPAA